MTAGEHVRNSSSIIVYCTYIITNNIVNLWHEPYLIFMLCFLDGNLDEQRSTLSLVPNVATAHATINILSIHDIQHAIARIHYYCSAISISMMQIYCECSQKICIKLIIHKSNILSNRRLLYPLAHARGVIVHGQ